MVGAEALLVALTHVPVSKVYVPAALAQLMLVKSCSRISPPNLTMCDPLPGVTVKSCRHWRAGCCSFRGVSRVAVAYSEHRHHEMCGMRRYTTGSRVSWDRNRRLPAIVWIVRVRPMRRSPTRSGKTFQCVTMPPSSRGTRVVLVGDIVEKGAVILFVHGLPSDHGELVAGADVDIPRPERKWYGFCATSLAP